LRAPSFFLQVSCLLLLAGCQSAPGNDFAFDAPSAIIEYQQAPTETEKAAETRVIVLGTGNPIPDPRRAGSSIAVIHKGRAYLFDIGAGAVKNATTARYRHDIPSLSPLRISAVFLTHMHNDHTADYPVLAGTLWWRRQDPLSLFGPAGSIEMSEGMYAMMGPDVRLRSGGTQPVGDSRAYRVDVTEIDEGVVFEADGMRVEAFEVNHGAIRPAFGYRITTEDKTIVISGDTARSEKLIEMARGADLLFHEVISDGGLSRNSEAMQAYHKRSHTLASELGRIATEAQPGLLVLYHALFYGVPEAQIVDEVRSTYTGPVVLADDLDIY